jgi:anaerobic magnesium-protoporphyrin IX monomethyl ester cyclase
VNKQDVLFVNLPPVSPSISDINDPTTADALSPPLGILYLADRIKDCEFINSYGCLDFAVDIFRIASEYDMIESYIGEKLAHAVIETPTVIAVSLMFSSSYEFFKIAIGQIRERWNDAVIMVGGIHASNTVEFLLNTHQSIDYVTCGEGEEAFVEFVEMMAMGTKKDILGVHSHDNLKIVGPNKYEQTNVVQNLDIDYTIYPNLLDMEKYTSETIMFSLSRTTLSIPSFTIMSSRGCPNRCSFCASHTVHGYIPRWRDLQNVVDEIYWLNKAYGVKKIYLIDDNFLPKSKAVELFAVLSNINIKDFEIVIQNMSINAMSHEIIDKIVFAGINNIAYAIETGSKIVQARINKRVNLEKAFDIVRYSQTKGLNVRCFYIIGFPNETLKEMQETIEYAKQLEADWSTFNVAVPIPGTEMYAEFIELGAIEDGPGSWTATSIRDRSFNTKVISGKDIKQLAYRTNLDINFINNVSIKKHDYESAELIFLNFIKSFDFHIFAYDSLRRIYKETGRLQQAKGIVEKMKELMKTNAKAKSFRIYFDLLDDDIRNQLEE